jgi:hypothetical protein
VDTSVPAAAPDATTARRGPPPARVTTPAVLLRLEGIALLGVAILLYANLGASWWLFAALLLAPDLGLAGYALGPGAGARTYNLTHTLSLPLALGAAGLLVHAPTLMAIALIWIAHIGMDRAVGYGLKYPASFRETHLQRVA